MEEAKGLSEKNPHTEDSQNWKLMSFPGTLGFSQRCFFKVLLVCLALAVTCRVVLVAVSGTPPVQRILPYSAKPRYKLSEQYQNYSAHELDPIYKNNSWTLHQREPFRYLIEESMLCRQHDDLYMITYIHSAVMRTEARQLIRETWGSLEYFNVTKNRVVFVFGAAATEEEQRVIDQESRRYHDIIQTNFVDTYKNLSYKGISALQWLGDNCMQARWVLKSDDDMIINIFALVDYLHYLETHTEEDIERILCSVWWGMPVLRGAGCAKWCVTKEEWPLESFPTYCSGSAFLFPTSLVPRLFEAYFKSPFLWVDDAYISGVLAQTAGIQHRAIHSLYELNHESIEENLVRGNRVFCHHPGDDDTRSSWWPLIARKEGY